MTHAITVELPRAAFGEAERPFLRAGELEAHLFRYDTGIEAVRLVNACGEIVMLPYLGAMVWDARFDGVRLGMESMFPAPRPAADILGTYGCLLYHAGLLRMGNPSPEDDHPLHGEMPCARMDSAALEAGEDAEGAYLRLVSRRDHAQGFGAHYLATPEVTLRPGRTEFDVTMRVRNLSAGQTMDLMYMAHANFAFPVGGRLVQPAPFTPEHAVVRTAVPAHVPRTPQYVALLDALARDPGVLEVLDDPERLDPEQVFYLRGLRADAQGRVEVLARRQEGGAFAISWPADAFSHVVRWLLYGPDQKVAGFALPSTCEPEGYTAEKRKGNVRSLAPGAEAVFPVRLGYLDEAAAERAEARIRAA